MKHKRYLLLVILILVLVGIGTVFYLANISDSEKSNIDDQAGSDGNYVPSLSTPSDEEINAIQDINERYRELIFKAQALQYDQKVESYDYYITAYKLETDEEIISKESREHMLINAYQRAEEASLSEVTDEIKNLIGEEKIQTYTEAVDKFNKEFNE